MTPGHSAGLPVLFLDRSLGRRQVPDLLRAAGIRLHTLAEVYGIPADEQVSDVDWLGHAGERGWPVLMKDDRIRYRPAERAAVIAHGVQAFCLSSGNLRASAMAHQFLAVLDDLAAVCQQPGPFLYTVSRPAYDGLISPLDSPRAIGQRRKAGQQCSCGWPTPIARAHTHQGGPA